MGMMGMSSMGMMGMQGQGMMGMQPTEAAEPEPEPEPEAPAIRTDLVQEAVDFVSKPEVKAQQLGQIKGYLTRHMGLTEPEMRAALAGVGLDAGAEPAPNNDEMLLPSTMEAADDDLYHARGGSAPAARRQPGDGSDGPSSSPPSWGEGLGGGAAGGLAGLPAAASLAALSWAADGGGGRLGAGGRGGAYPYPTVVINRSGVAVGAVLQSGGAGGGRLGALAARLSQRRLLLTLLAVALAYLGLREHWRRTARPWVRGLLTRAGAALGLEIKPRWAGGTPCSPRWSPVPLHGLSDWNFLA
jgi:hypothetical protein